MKCKDCLFENPEGSKFCENCGVSLHHDTQSPHHRMIHELDDVIFTPKKKTQFLRNFIIIFIVLILGLAGVALMEVNQHQVQSNLYNPDPAQTTLNNISIENDSMKWIGQELYYVGTLKNKNSFPITDVVVRLDLYKDKNSENLFDTRKITVSGAEADGAFSFEIPVNAYPTSQFWWTKVIESTN